MVRSEGPEERRHPCGLSSLPHPPLPCPYVSFSRRARAFAFKKIYFYHVELNARGGWGKVGGDHSGIRQDIRTPVALDRETNDSGNGKEETKTEEADVRCSTLFLRTSVLADSLLLYWHDPVVPYAGYSISSYQRFDMHAGRTVISVEWFGAGRRSGG